MNTSHCVIHGSVCIYAAADEHRKRTASAAVAVAAPSRRSGQPKEVEALVQAEAEEVDAEPTNEQYRDTIRNLAHHATLRHEIQVLSIVHQGAQWAALLRRAPLRLRPIIIKASPGFATTYRAPVKRKAAAAPAAAPLAQKKKKT